MALTAAAGLHVRGIPQVEANGERAAQARSCVYDHMTMHTGPTRCRPRARAYPSSVASSVQKAIYDSSLEFGVPYKTLLTIAKCESALDPRASSGTHFGLYQFAPATFKRAISQMRTQTGVMAHSYWNALDSAYTAGFMFVTGAASSWSCVSAIPTSGASG
jgi:hypothetical protein